MMRSSASDSSVGARILELPVQITQTCIQGLHGPLHLSHSPGLHFPRPRGSCLQRVVGMEIEYVCWGVCTYVFEALLMQDGRRMGREGGQAASWWRKRSTKIWGEPS